MREALHLALDHALQADERVFLLGEDIADPGASGPTAGLSTKFGHDRVLDTPISDAAILGAAIGAAIDGLLPVAEIMIMDFIGIAADQLINNAAKLRFMTAGRTTASRSGSPDRGRQSTMAGMGGRPATLHDVARAAAVSVATASRTLNGSARTVRQENAARVLAGSLSASRVAQPTETTITSGLAQSIAPSSVPSTASSVTAPAAIASGAMILAWRPPESARPTPAPMSAAVNGAKNET